jgi:hypothetical protein
MKRLLMIAVAMAACLAFGSISVALAGPKTKNVTSTISLSFKDAGNPTYNPYDRDRFEGKVNAKKRFCRKKRSVSVKNTGTGQVVETTTTDQDGEYSVDATPGATTGPYNPSAGTYRAKVKTKKRVKPNGNVLRCRRASSKLVTVPAE